MTPHPDLTKQLKDILEDCYGKWMGGEVRHFEQGKVSKDQTIKALSDLIHQREREARIEEIELWQSFFAQQMSSVDAYVDARLATLKQEEEK